MMPRTHFYLFIEGPQITNDLRAMAFDLARDSRVSYVGSYGGINVGCLERPRNADRWYSTRRNDIMVYPREWNSIVMFPRIPRESEGAWSKAYVSRDKGRMSLVDGSVGNRTYHNFDPNEAQLEVGVDFPTPMAALTNRHITPSMIRERIASVKLTFWAENAQQVAV